MFARTKTTMAVLSGALAVAGAAMSGSAMPSSYQSPPTKTLKLAPSTPALAACFPHASAKVVVELTTDDIGKDKFTIYAKGLQPKTDFTLFLIEKAGPPFGAAEYFGDFTTDKYGRATNTFEFIVEESFNFNNETGVRVDNLNSVGFWFADETADDKCLGVNSPVTGFDGDGKAGVQMMNSGAHFLP